MEKNKNRKISIPMAFSYVIIGLLCSCDILSEEDGEYVSPYIYELATVWTDSKGNLSLLQNDKDERFIISDTATANRYFISASPASTKLEHDSSYRMLCYYEKNNNMAQILGMNYVISKKATPTSELAGRSIIQDPVEIQSIWISGGYLNIYVRINIFDKQHELFSIKQSDSPKTIFSLYHDSHDDEYGYFRNACLSIPLSDYDLNKGDTVFFNCKGYKNDYSYSLVY